MSDKLCWAKWGNICLTFLKLALGTKRLNYECHFHKTSSPAGNNPTGAEKAAPGFETLKDLAVSWYSLSMFRYGAAFNRIPYLFHPHLGTNRMKATSSAAACFLLGGWKIQDPFLLTGVCSKLWFCMQFALCSGKPHRAFNYFFSRCFPQLLTFCRLCWLFVFSSTVAAQDSVHDPCTPARGVSNAPRR